MTDADDRTATTHDEGLPAIDPGGEPPEDDRNERVEDSPVPDPTEGATDTGDVPQAD